MFANSLSSAVVFAVAALLTTGCAPTNIADPVLSERQQYMALQDELTRLKYEIIDRHARLRASGIHLSPEQLREVQVTLRSAPKDAAILRATIVEAFLLSERLRSLAQANSK